MTTNFLQPMEGFESMFNTRNTLLKSLTEPATTGYPPYNIIRESPSKLTIEIAAAGSSLDEFDVTCSDGSLTVICSPKKADKVDYIHQGLSYKRWRREFALTTGIEAKGAELTDGILRVFLEYTEPKVNRTKVEIRNGNKQVLHG
jgi:molecular chaperone IbpA